MTTFNTDYNNTEDSLLDQELTIEELEAVAGGILPAVIHILPVLLLSVLSQKEKM